MNNVPVNQFRTVDFLLWWDIEPCGEIRAVREAGWHPRSRHHWRAQGVVYWLSSKAMNSDLVTLLTGLDKRSQTHSVSLTFYFVGWHYTKPATPIACGLRRRSATQMRPEIEFGARAYSYTVDQLVGARSISSVCLAPLVEVDSSSRFLKWFIFPCLEKCVFWYSHTDEKRGSSGVVLFWVKKKICLPK